MDSDLSSTNSTVERVKRRLSSPETSASKLHRFYSPFRQPERIPEAEDIAEPDEVNSKESSSPGSLRTTAKAVAYDADESDCEEEEHGTSPGKRQQIGFGEEKVRVRDEGSQTSLTLPEDFDFLQAMEKIKKMSDNEPNHQQRSTFGRLRRKQDCHNFNSDDGSDAEEFKLSDISAVSSIPHDQPRAMGLDASGLFRNFAIQSPDVSPIRPEQEDEECSSSTRPFGSPDISPIASSSSKFPRIFGS